jgi:hypothetical protein
VLFISYNEYSNRYSLISTSDNSIYIFDKKSTVLNKCDEKGCSIIETKLPLKSAINSNEGFQPSKLFESEKPMVKATLASVEKSVPAQVSEQTESSENASEKAVPEETDSSKQMPEKKKEKVKAEDSKEEAVETKKEETHAEPMVRLGLFCVVKP